MSETHRIAANIRAELARRSIRQAALAKHLGISQAAVSRRVNGQTEFAVKHLLAVAALLDMSAADLLASDAAAVGDAA